MLRSFFKCVISKTVEYSLKALETIGNATAKLAVKLSKIFVKQWQAFVRRFTISLKRWQRTFVKCGKFVSSIFADIVARTKRNAEKYGKMSGFFKFGEEIFKNTVRNKRFLFKAFNFTAPIFAVLIVFFVATSFNNVTLAYEVKYDGDTIGYVSDETVYSQASNIVKDQVEGSAELSTEPVLNVTLVSQDKISTADDLSEKIIETSGELTDGFGLYINDKFVLASAKESTINAALEQAKSDAIAKTKADDAEFVDDVKIKSGLYCDIQLMNEQRIVERLTSDVLSIKTTKTTVKTEVLKYSTITAKDNTKYEGYKRVKVSGSNGEKVSKILTTYVDGKAEGTDVISSTVTKATVDEQIIVGTRKIPSSASVNVNAKFAWPVERGSSSYVSQYFGNGGHTGIDIAAYSGTPIYSLSNGRVIEVIYKGTSYGNHFKVDYGNGIVALYAHCSTIKVEVGDVVEMGQTIATVGSTGNSTGPHLHLEIIKNGEKVNPGPYIGLD